MSVCRGTRTGGKTTHTHTHTQREMNSLKNTFGSVDLCQKYYFENRNLDHVAIDCTHLASPPSGSDRGWRTLRPSWCGRQIHSGRRLSTHGGTADLASATSGSRSRGEDLSCGRPGDAHLKIWETPSKETCGLDVTTLSCFALCSNLCWNNVFEVQDKMFKRYITLFYISQHYRWAEHQSILLTSDQFVFSNTQV